MVQWRRAPKSAQRVLKNARERPRALTSVLGGLLNASGGGVYAELLQRAAVARGWYKPLGLGVKRILYACSIRHASEVGGGLSAGALSVG